MRREFKIPAMGIRSCRNGVKWATSECVKTPIKGFKVLQAEKQTALPKTICTIRVFQLENDIHRRMQAVVLYQAYLIFVTCHLPSLFL